MTTIATTLTCQFDANASEMDVENEFIRWKYYTTGAGHDELTTAFPHDIDVMDVWGHVDSQRDLGESTHVFRGGSISVDLLIRHPNRDALPIVLDAVAELFDALNGDVTWSDPSDVNRGEL